MATGDSGREAYTAIAWGVGLSHERSDIAGAEGFHSLEGNMCGTARRGADALPRSKATSRAKGSHRNLGDSRIWPPSSRAVCVRRSALGRRGAEANDARTREVGPRHSSYEAGEQSEGSPLRRRLRGRTQRSRWSEGRGPRGIRTSTTRTGPRARLVTNALERIRPLSPSHTRGGSRMRESRTYGSVRGACDETHVPTATGAHIHRPARRGGGPAIA